MSKICTKCKNLRDILEFHKNKYSKDGLQNWCKFCKNQEYNSRTVEYRKNNREKILARQREWRKNNKDKVKNHVLMDEYGITLEKYKEMLTEQDNKCAICKTDQSQVKKKFSVDHDHSSGFVRALLCQSCNLLLGRAQDDVSILKSSIAYLEKYK